jgi:hypothetical protein
VSSPALFLILARFGCKELIRQIDFLKAVNEMLRERISKFRIRTAPAERERLIELGKALQTWRVLK